MRPRPMQSPGMPYRALWPLSTLALLALAVGCGVASDGPSEQNLGSREMSPDTISADPVPLFAQADAPETVPLPERAGPANSMQASVNFGELEKPALILNLPQGGELRATRDRNEALDASSSVWVGRVDGDAGSEVVLARRGTALAGTIQHKGVVYEVEPTPSGDVLVFAVDEARQRPVCAGDDELPSMDGETDTAMDVAGDAPAQGTVVDLMVVYSPASRARYGRAGLEAKIVSAVAGANQAYVNSKVDMQLNLTHLAEIPYKETGSMSDSLTRLRKTSDGVVDEVHGWRDQHHADLVLMVTEDKGYCGIASLMTSPSPSAQAGGFSIVASGCLSNSLAHELGHNMGSAHDRDNASRGAYPYSFGHRYCGNGGYRTIMAYACTSSPRLNYFSNPSVTVNGRPTGVDHDADAAHSADNARSLNNTRGVVAAFRGCGESAAPPTPSGLRAEAKGASSILVQWGDVARESGFRLERAGGGKAWSEVARLGPDKTSYTDNGLTVNTRYEYRVRAANCVGLSSYSSVASSTTLAQPQCQQGADCNDGDSCTKDICNGGACVHTDNGSCGQGTSIDVNFQPAGVVTPSGYLPDTGQTYRAMSNGQTYGWNRDHSVYARDRNLSSDQRLDSLVHFAAGGRWEIKLPSGSYDVTVAIGDPGYPSTYTVNVEGVSYWNRVSLAANTSKNLTKTVEVTDGNLTVEQGSAGEKATRINYIRIAPSSAGGGTVATLFQHCSFGGWSVPLGQGSFTPAQLLALGARDNDASSVRIAAGYEVALYDGADFTGACHVVSADNACFVGANFNDKTSSLRVQTAGTGCAQMSAQHDYTTSTEMNGVPCEGLASAWPGGAMSVDFVNPSAARVSVAWVDYQGTAVPRFFLAPGQTQTVTTYTTHPWVIQAETGECLAAYVSSAP